MQRLLPPWPRALRARARRCRASLHALRRDLLVFSSLAQHLARDPSLSERIDTSAYDLTAADVLAAADRLLDALDDIID